MRSRTAASVVLAAALLLGSTGCTFFSTIATDIPYNPSDGVGTNVGDVKVRNIIAITADGVDVNLVLAVVNSGTSTARVGFQYEVDGEKFTEQVVVSAGETLSLGAGDEQPLRLTDVGATVGGVLPIYVQHGDEQGQEVLVPVLDGELPEYAELVP